MTESLPFDPAHFCATLLGVSLNGVYVHDIEAGRHTYVNAEYARLTGYDRDRLAALDVPAFRALFHADDQPRIAAHLAALRAAADGEVREIAYRFRRPDGVWIRCLARDTVLERAADGAVRSILGACIDLGRTQEACTEPEPEPGVRESDSDAEALLREIETLYARAPIGLCLLDRDLRFVRINERLAEINGLGVEQHLGRTVREVLPLLAREVEPLLQRVLATGEPVVEREVSGETPARPGVRRIWLESFLPLRNAAGEVCAIHALAREVTDERRDREALAASREHYRLIADFTYDWELWVGPGGRLRWMSPSCRRLTGYPADAFYADPGLLERIAHPDDRPALRAHLKTSPGGGDPARLEFRIRRADGQTRWLEYISQEVRGTDGGYAGRRASARDVTVRREAEAALAAREREFETLVANAPDIIVRFDRRLRHLYVNAAVERATGRAPSEFLGKTNEELGMPPALCARWSDCLRRVFATGEPQSLEFGFPAPDRERFYSMRAVPERAPDGGVETVLAVTRDDTERRRAEARARSLAAVVERSGDFIGIARLDGRALYLNHAGQRLVGLCGEAAVQATRIEDYLFPEDLPFVRETVLPQVLREGHWSGDFRFRHFRTAEAIDVHWGVVRIDDPATGEPAQLATVTRDIRQEKAAAAALEDASRRKDEFLAMLGHELRNPMAPIRNAVEMLQLAADGANKGWHPAADPKIGWAVAVLDRQTRHLNRLLDDLLDVSRIVRGRLVLQRRPVVVREVVQQALEGIRSRVAERRHRLEAELPDAEIEVEGDPVRLGQILLNLLLNAVDYTQEGGTIRVASEADAREVILRVCDNGAGIPPDRIEHLFTPFVQGQTKDSAAGSAPSGLGLGLAISRRLAELHGGRLLARSDWPQPGSEFSLHLPRHLPTRRDGAASARQADPRPEAFRRERRGPAPGLSVLVVDDNADVCAALAMLLRTLGCRVETAASGSEALALAACSCPRLALLDIGLPDMDGLELAQRLRAQCPDKDRLSLVAVTGYGHEEARRRSLAAGFDKHLAKPVDLATLTALLEELDR